MNFLLPAPLRDGATLLKRFVSLAGICYGARLFAPRSTS